MTTPTIELLSPELVGKDVIISLADEDGGDVEGRCIAANEKAVVVKAGSKSRLIERYEILDLEVVDKTKPKRIQTRWIAEATLESVRQHLADRHGMPVDLIPASKQDALDLHSRVNHEKTSLGHRHGEKPVRRRRTVQATPQEVADRAAMLGVAEGSTPEDFEGDEE